LKKACSAPASRKACGGCAGGWAMRASGDAAPPGAFDTVTSVVDRSRPTRPSQGSSASRSSVPFDVAAHWFAAPSASFARPRGLPPIGLPGPEGPCRSRRLGRPPRASATVPFRSRRSKSPGSDSVSLPKELAVVRPRRSSLGPGPKTLAAGPIPRDRSWSSPRRARCRSGDPAGPALPPGPEGPRLSNGSRWVRAAGLIPKDPSVGPFPEDPSRWASPVGPVPKNLPEGSARWVRCSPPGVFPPLQRSRRLGPLLPGLPHPARSALGVSHPLDGLLPCRPAASRAAVVRGVCSGPLTVRGQPARRRAADNHCAPYGTWFAVLLVP
jgi:hypothetical protein